jgi:ribosome recycling factor
MSQKEIISNADQKMVKSIEAFKASLAKIRTGRAHTGLLEHIQVDCCGNPTPISQVAALRFSRC